jgi:hypothetical protein
VLEVISHKLPEVAMYRYLPAEGNFNDLLNNTLHSGDLVQAQGTVVSYVTDESGAIRELVLENNGKEEIVSRGDAGENLIATGSFGKGPIRPFRRVILRQKAPALGHASGFMALHETPVPEFRPYC